MSKPPRTNIDKELDEMAKDVFSKPVSPIISKMLDVWLRQEILEKARKELE